MQHDVWRTWLGYGYSVHYPDESAEILRGITHGVRIEFTGPRDVNRRCANHPMSDEHRDKVSAIIAADIASGKKSGPHVTPPFPFMWCSPIGCVPKKGTDKVRVIHDLSHGKPESVNDYVTYRVHHLGCLDDALNAIRRLGPGCYLVKLDVEAAYKQVPVDPKDWHLIGFTWLGKYYYDRTLPFGMRSSCRKWDLYATALHYFMQHHLGIRCTVHYVDDFLFVIRTLDDATSQRDMALRMCAQLGVPMSPKKTEGPVTCLTFLGIEIDTVAMVARLSADRLTQLHELLLVWGDRTTTSLRELQSLTGLLTFVTRVVRPGRVYLHSLIKQTTAIMRSARVSHAKPISRRARETQHTLWPSVRSDIAWWSHSLRGWNGVGLLYELEWSNAVKLELYTDACLTGYGALCGTRWFQGQWSSDQLAAAHRFDRASMPYLELLALVLAASTFGDRWAGRLVLFHCDCQPVVQALAKRCSSQPDMHHLIRELHSIAARSQFDFRVEHIAGVANESADALSRYMMPAFRAASPDADAQPTPVVPLSLPLSASALPSTTSSSP